MGAANKRIDLYVDVFEELEQLASARRELMPDELIKAILLEFQELTYLTDDPAQYDLVRLDTDEPLDPAVSIGAQLRDGIRLKLVERRLQPPRRAAVPPANLYLTDQATGKVYRLPWLPAIVGRDDKNQPQNDLVAVDLSSSPTGLRVSRRHVMISGDTDGYSVACLSSNPATVIRGEAQQPLTAGKLQDLEDGDFILLDRSNIRLRFMVRKPAQDAVAELVGTVTGQGANQDDRGVQGDTGNEQEHTSDDNLPQTGNARANR